jgi:hypothetical protein
MMSCRSSMLSRRMRATPCPPGSRSTTASAVVSCEPTPSCISLIRRARSSATASLRRSTSMALAATRCSSTTLATSCAFMASTRRRIRAHATAPTKGGAPKCPRYGRSVQVTRC